MVAAGSEDDQQSGGHVNTCSVFNTPNVLQRCNILGKAYNICQERDFDSSIAIIK